MHKARKFTGALFQDACKLLDGTRRLGEVAKSLGVNPDNLSKFLGTRGFTPVYPARESARRKDLPDREIVAAYVAGMSELQIAKDFGVSRNVVRRRLIESGTQVRDQSQAGVLSASRVGGEQRKQRVSAAHDAVRGKKRSVDELAKRAMTKMRVDGAVVIGEGENEFAQALAERGVSFVRQYAVGKYNLDFLVGSVAVELKSGPSKTAAAFRDVGTGRIEDLAKSGFRTLYVCFSDTRALAAATNEIVTLVDEFNRQPSPIRQYWMVSCRLQNYAIVRDDREQFSRVPSPEQLIYSVRKFDI